MTTIQSIVDRVGYSDPLVITDSDYSCTTVFEYPSTKRAPTFETAYLNGERLVIGTKRSSNELCDFKNSYLIWEDILVSSWLDTLATWNTRANNEPLYKAALASGVPFESVEEVVNGNLIIHNCPKALGRFRTLGMLAQGDLESVMGFTIKPNQPVQGSDITTTQLNVPQPFVVSCSGPHPYGLLSHPFKTLINSLMSRAMYKYVTCSDGNWGPYYRKCVLPLNALSKLANCPRFVPLGLMNQTSNTSWELRLTLTSAMQMVSNAVFVAVPLGTQEQGFQYRMLNPKLALKVISINNPSILQQLMSDFNNVARPDGLLKNIILPFNNSEYRYSRILANSTSNLFQFNINHRSLKGVAVRFYNNAMNLPESNHRANEKNLGDAPFTLNGFQWTIGVYKYPAQFLDFANTNSQMLTVMNGSGNHLIRPDGLFRPEDSLTYVNDENYYKSNLNNFCSFTWSFENFPQTPGDLDQSPALATGIDTLTNGNIVKLYITHAAQEVDTEMQLEFIYQDALLVSNGAIRCIYDQSNVTSIFAPA